MAELANALRVHHGSASPIDRRRYIEILKKDDGDLKAIPELFPLMVKLGLDTRDVEQHQELLERVPSLRESVRIGRDAAVSIEAARQNLHAYDAETDRLARERDDGRTAIQQHLIQLSGKTDAAEKSIEEFSRLKTEFPMIMAEEPDLSAKDMA